MINENLILSSHDISDGGLIVTLSEMALYIKFWSKNNKPKKLTNLINYFFGEDQARYVVEIKSSNLEKAEKILRENNIYYENIGYTQKEFFGN